MEHIQDETLKKKIERINSWRKEGKYVFSTGEPENSGLPLQRLQSVSPEARSTWRDGADYETDWAYFLWSYQTEYLLVSSVLKPGKMPPETVLPQDQIELCEATIKPGWVEFTLGGETIHMDVDICQSAEDIMKALNRKLVAEFTPAAVWKISWEPEELMVINIYNGSVSVTASCAVWDSRNRQLVAATLIGENPKGVAGASMVRAKSDQGIQAILATLADNGGSKDSLGIRCPGRVNTWLNGARRGYTVVNGNTGGGHENAARVIVAQIEHPLAGDPSRDTSPFFYILAITGEDFIKKFAARLDLAIAWGFKPEWTFTLLEEAKKKGIVHDLDKLGEGYTHAVCGSRDRAAWQALLAETIKEQVRTW